MGAVLYRTGHMRRRQVLKTHAGRNLVLVELPPEMVEKLLTTVQRIQSWGTDLEEPLALRGLDCSWSNGSWLGHRPDRCLSQHRQLRQPQRAAVDPHHMVAVEAASEDWFACKDNLVWMDQG